MRLPLFNFMRIRTALFVAALCVCAGEKPASAQSSDVSFPAPVFSNEVVARISPRDLGDSRLTRHFYIFKGTEGDLTLTVESADLNGDVDIFVAKTLRPLLKVTLFGGTATKATKSVYLRREETLILRVEARAVGDTDGNYRILLGGSFAPAPPDLAAQPPADLSTPTAETSTRRGTTRRVTSTGARIEEPQAEVAEATPTPTPEPTPAEAATTEPKPAAKREPPRSRRGRNSRSTTGRASRPAAGTATTETPRDAEPAAKDTADTTKPEAEKTESATATPAERTPPRTTRRRNSRSNVRRPPATEPADAADAKPTTPAPPPPVVTILRLVIVTKDGETIERDMSTVRRVTVENNQIVVVLRDGKVVRTPLAIVAKMSFEP